MYTTNFFVILYEFAVVFSKNRLLQVITFAFSVIIILILHIPFIYLMYLSLTFGATGIITMLTLIALSLLIPIFKHYIVNCRNKRLDDITDSR